LIGIFILIIAIVFWKIKSKEFASDTNIFRGNV
jgi:cbb3-type cytochrome oxidase subunit 3